MSFVPNFPPSLTRKIKEDNGDEKKKTKDDYRKMKELEEARKLAVMPAMKDEEGRDINPHIPQYIMQAPWYYGSLHPTLQHQRIQGEEKREEISDQPKGSTSLNRWYIRGAPQKLSKSLKYKDGACENCGSMTHKRKDCMERPRKVGAKYSGVDIAPDDYDQIDLTLGYEAKRDRWNGYDPREHKKLVQEYQRLEEARKLAKAKKIEEKLVKAVAESTTGQEEPAASAAKPSLEEDADLDMDDGDRYGDELDMPGQKFDSKQRQSIRNLRIREDTAKYLFNLDPNSAFYDPKTRAMRENPFEGTGKPESEVPFAGDNFVRYDGDVVDMVNRQVFGWEMHNKRGLDVHLQADPTRLELLAKRMSTAKSDEQKRVRNEILDRYGGREFLQDQPPKELLLGQWESYAEYTPTGRVVKGVEPPTVKSRYEEDVFVKNHTSIWGSYWFNGQWGYKCCQSFVKESYCMGEKGKQLNNPELPSSQLPPPPLIVGEGQINTDEIEPSTGRKRRRHSRSNSSSSSCSSRSSSSSSASSSSDSDSSQEDRDQEAKRKEQRSRRKKKLLAKKKNRRMATRNNKKTSANDDNLEAQVQAAIEREKERLTQVDAFLALDERKRPYNSMTCSVAEPTEAEMEAYHRTKVNRDDPMAHFP